MDDLCVRSDSAGSDLFGCIQGGGGRTGRAASVGFHLYVDVYFYNHMSVYV
jgi:FAD/FMN-containing dehydrogenase